MKNILTRLYTFFSKPIIEELSVFLILSIFICTPLLVGFILKTRDVYLAIWETLHGLIMCYVGVLLLTLIPIRFRTIFRTLLCVMGFLDFMVECSCWITIGWKFHQDIIAIIMESNLSEGREFISTYLSTTIIFLGILSIGLLFFFYKKQVLENLGKKISWLLLPFVMFSTLFFVVKQSGSWENKFLLKVVSFICYESSPDLSHYNNDLQVSLNGDIPDNLIVIIGESFSKYHSSLYGYEKNTNPRLGKLLADSTLCVFNNVISPHTYTIPCIKSVISAYSSMNSDAPWYEYVSLPQIMSKAGYKTFWISNQSPAGFSDNVASCYSKLCDSTIWVGSRVKGVYKTDKDAAILDVLDGFTLNNNTNKNFIVIHLMGSHCSYELRYPKDWEIFSPSNYPTKPEHQRPIIAAYDNSIVYNDWVVSEVFEKFKNTETLALYFSDHGLDMFATSDHYFGYARENDELSQTISKSIPFIWYYTNLTQQNFGYEISYIKTIRDNPFNTENLIDLLLDVLKIEIK